MFFFLHTIWKFIYECVQLPILNSTSTLTHTEFANGLRNGKGIYKYPDNSVYEGEYKNDKKHGKGIFRYSNGDVYDGSYKVRQVI